MKKKIGVVTVARSDFGIYRSLLTALSQHADFELQLYVTGMHLSDQFGCSVEEIEEAGFPIAARIEMLLGASTPSAIGKSIGNGTAGFAQEFARQSPDLLFLLGDRFEMLAAASAALAFTIPLAHIHGGEITEGAIDDVIRHSLTKMSHLHFVSLEEYARRVRQMGEEPWRVTVCGAPALDTLRGVPTLDRDQFAARYGVTLPERFILATYHPVTLEYQHTEARVRDFLGALETTALPVLFTGVNADTHGHSVTTAVREYVARHPGSALVDSLGLPGYCNAMRLASVMAGNSSSGIIEAASFRLPVVNVGIRQRGRVRAPNVIDVPDEKDAIAEALQRALSPDFRASLATLENPYGSGNAAEIIVRELEKLPPRDILLSKKFQDV